MGADIHWFTEIKIEDEWHPLFMPTPQEIVEKEMSKFENRQHWIDYFSNRNHANYSGRNYYLFTFLAGVRGHETPYIEPRGIPQDCSRLIKKLYEKWSGDAHTPHWYLLSELVECDWRDYYTHDGDELSHFFLEYLPRFYTLGIDFNKIRHVFWFDN